MAKDPLDYDWLMQNALRGLAREALRITAERQSLPGDHHFYLTFRTRFPGVRLPERLLERHPQEMTIVIQHQYFGLEVALESFSVTLSFDGKLERLTIPFLALSAFVDPAVKFGLQFPAATGGGAPDAKIPPALVGPAPSAHPPEGERAKEPAQIVTLDAFRKK